MPLWFTTKFCGEWVKLVREVSRGSHFTWRDAKSVKRQSQGDCSHTKVTTFPDKCVASNHGNVADLLKCICA